MEGYIDDEATARAQRQPNALTQAPPSRTGARIEACASVHLDVNTMHRDEAANVLAQSFIGREDSVPRSTDTGSVWWAYMAGGNMQYRTPELRSLGTLTDLTMGMNGSCPDGQGNNNNTQLGGMSTCGVSGGASGH
jgi:hypothetical protein